MRRLSAGRVIQRKPAEPRTREISPAITRFTAAARLVGDPTVLTEMLDWLRDVPRQPRRGRRSSLNAGLGALAPVIRRTDPEAARLVLDAITGRARFMPPGESG